MATVITNALSAFASIFKGIGTTYSFKDLSGAITSTLAGVFPFAGQIGAGRISVEYITDHGALDTAADGTVLPSFVAGRAGRITIEVQQTSAFHKYLLFWHNVHVTMASSGDISSWAGTSLLIRNTLDGSSHAALGVIPTKIPDKAYAASPTMITWTLLCSNLNSL
jgi:hypothetical protein